MSSGRWGFPISKSFVDMCTMSDINFSVKGASFDAPATSTCRGLLFVCHLYVSV